MQKNNCNLCFNKLPSAMRTMSPRELSRSARVTFEIKYDLRSPCGQYSIIRRKGVISME